LDSLFLLFGVFFLKSQDFAQDSYLIGKMDKDHFVDVSVIAEFKLIKQLTTDVDLILASVKGSEQVLMNFYGGYCFVAS
jgi:hypothetical protein